MPSIEEYPEAPPTNQLPSGSSVITVATIGGIVGVYFVSPLMGVLHIVPVAFTSLLFVAAWCFRPRYYLAVYFYRKRKAAFVAKRQAIHARAAMLEAEYTAAYEAAFPAWEAWLQADNDAFKQREARAAAKEAAHKEREERSAAALNTLLEAHNTLRLRAALELELTDKNDTLALLREALKSLGKKHPDLGLLRGTAGYPIENIQDLLPPLPTLPPLPPAPIMPTPPTISPPLEVEANGSVIANGTILSQTSDYWPASKIFHLKHPKNMNFLYRAEQEAKKKGA